MCGIAGILDPHIGSKKEVIEKMTELIRHRGPDEDGFLVDDYVGLGMRRLSIIDLSSGKQPMVSRDGRYQIFFNGEIYNYKELKEVLEKEGITFDTTSDTEVILRLYEKEGKTMLPKLRGMFAICIYDSVEQKVFLARDFFGIKPLYYLKAPPTSPSDPGRVLAFSSEMKSFYAIPGFKAEVNDAAVFNYLSYQYNPLRESFLKNVWKLPPAHHITISLPSGNYVRERYWQYNFHPEKLDFPNTKKEILATMEDSVSHHMIADVPVGSFLSGGIDSSTIVTLMQKIRGEKKVKTFTVTFGKTSEGAEARETAEPLGTEHKEIEVGEKEYFEALPKAIWHFDEPVGDPSALGLYFLSREASKEVKVVLSGEGSDELFGGYNIYRVPIASRKLAWLPKSVINVFLSLPFEYFGKNYLRRVNMNLEDWYFGQKYFNESIFKPSEIQRVWRGEIGDLFSLDKYYRQIDSLSDSTKMQFIDIHTWLVGDILAKADKMTMAHSLELRVPFLDLEVGKVASKLPDNFKWRGGETKYALREAFKGILPESTRKRRKLGFPTPLKHWLDKDKKDLYERITSNNYIKNRFNVVEVERIISDHVNGRADNARKIYLLLSLALWYNIFIENNGRP